MLKTVITAALALAPAPVIAQGTAVPPTARVQVADLDLATRDGLRTLDRRLKTAVRDLCPGQPSPDLQQMREHRVCVAAATRSAAEQRRAALARRAEPVGIGLAAR